VDETLYQMRYQHRKLSPVGGAVTARHIISVNKELIE